MWFAFSVDLEPNKDGSLDGVGRAMEWYAETVPRGTVYTTYRIATELPDLVADLATDHELGVHVHPREFGHDHDQFGDLSRDRQRDLVDRTRHAVADAAALDIDDVTVFRAGRHSATTTTLSVLADLGFEVDASAHVNYDWLPESIGSATDPLVLDNGLVELPTSRHCGDAPVRLAAL